MNNNLWPIRISLSICPSNSFVPVTIQIYLLPFYANIFPSSHQVLLQQRGPPDPPRWKGIQARDTNKIVRHPMNFLEFLASGSPPCVTYPWRMYFPTFFMVKSTHKSLLSLKYHSITTCGTTACYTCLLGTFSLMPKEILPHEVIFSTLSK